MKAGRIRVWDWPTRAFHWMLVASFAAAFATGDSERWRDVHIMLGYTIAGLVAFRVLWGLAGGRHARFSDFVAGPRRVLTYLNGMLQGRPHHCTGHNPAGGWVILALLAGLALVAASGWANEAGLGGRGLEELHEGLANALLALVGLHLAGVVASSVLHRENLVSSMIHGYKRGAPGESSSRAHRLAAVLLVVGVAAFWTWGRALVA